ncbi:MAG: hypothetical protein SGPRY_013559, partial [Prymnesium sp.]
GEMGGGTCTCPDGVTYKVGYTVGNANGCTHLACVGGVSGACHIYKEPETFPGGGFAAICAVH